MNMEMVWKEACDKHTADRWGKQFVQELGFEIHKKNPKTNTQTQPNVNPLKSPGI